MGARHPQRARLRRPGRHEGVGRRRTRHGSAHAKESHARDRVAREGRRPGGLPPLPLLGPSEPPGRGARAIVQEQNPARPRRGVLQRTRGRLRRIRSRRRIVAARAGGDGLGQKRMRHPRRAPRCARATAPARGPAHRDHRRPGRGRRGVPPAPLRVRRRRRRRGGGPFEVSGRGRGEGGGGGEGLGGIRRGDKTGDRSGDAPSADSRGDARGDAPRGRAERGRDGRGGGRRGAGRGGRGRRTRGPEKTGAGVASCREGGARFVVS